MCPPKNRARHLIFDARRQMRLIDDTENSVRAFDTQRSKPTVLDDEDTVIWVADYRSLVLRDLDDDEPEEFDDGVGDCNALQWLVSIQLKLSRSV